MIRHEATFEAPPESRVLALGRRIAAFAEQRFAVAGARPGIRSSGKLSSAIFPPVRKLGANGRELGLRVDEAVAIHHRELVLVAHGNGIDRADLRAEPAEEAATRAQDELTQLAVSLLGRDDVHLQARGGADAGTETAGHAQRLARIRIGAERWEAPIARRHVPLFFGVLDGHLWLEEPLEGDLETLDFVKHA